MQQALTNLLDNALDFCPVGGVLRVSAGSDSGVDSSDSSDSSEGQRISVRIFNQGEAIPDFALARVTERFFSLARPATGKKSTGLGLNFVQQVAALHCASLQLRNLAGGVEATLEFPCVHKVS